MHRWASDHGHRGGGGHRGGEEDATRYHARIHDNHPGVFEHDDILKTKLLWLP